MKNTQQTSSLERLEKKDIKIKLNITKKIVDQIKYLCGKIPNLEWSGILFYDVEGSIKDPKNMVINTIDILPLDKGSSGFTNFNSNLTDGNNQVKVSKHWMKLGLDKKQGTIHSHNNMGVFLSGTDWSEVEDNTPNHNYYLFVVVNNKLDILAKVSYVSKSTVIGQARDDEGNFYNPFEGQEKEFLVVYDCDVNIIPNIIEVSEEFTSHVEDIMKPKSLTTYSTSKDSKIGKSYTINSFEDYEWANWHYRENSLKKVTKKGESAVKNKDPYNEVSKLWEEGEIDDFIKFLLEDESTDKFSTYMEVLEFYGYLQIDPSTIAQSVKKEFNSLYNLFFEDYPNRFNFKKDVLKQIITELELEKKNLQTTEYSYPYLKSLIKVFKEILILY